MKKMKTVCLLLSIVLIVSTFGSCKKEEAVLIPLSYDNEIREGGIKDDGQYNHKLFYRNDTELNCPDPHVLYISDPESEEYGYYYLYGTTSSSIGYETYRSKDLHNWERMINVTGHMAFLPDKDHVVNTNFYAPEVIYDEESRKYYMFYSGSPKSKTNIYYICVAVSDQPYGPFVPCTENGLDKTKTLFDVEKANAAVAEADGWTWSAIDPSPFIGADGQKYLLFCMVSDPGDNYKDTIWGVRMNSWSSPDYSTLVRLTRVGYKTPDKSEKLDYESQSPRNEGPRMYIRKHDDGTVTYYLTMSINGLNDYTVTQAIGDSPLGPFRKLTEDEGGIILANDNLSWDHIKGPGHHAFIEIGGELFIVYHQQGDRQLGGSWNRYVAIDRVYFVKNLKGQEVMYINGPTWSIQPQIEAFSEYKNIAGQAKISATAGENIEALTDKLFTLYKSIDYVKEYETDKTATISLDFGDYREITALMIYNSLYYEKAFPYIDRVEFDFKNDALPEGATAYIDMLDFDWTSYKNSNSDEMRPGGSAVAVFAPLQVKTIRITLRLPLDRPEEIEILDDEGYVVQQTIAAISEIVVLGK
ncbi:MAG: family 43 glycosylhydrolase [Clostridiaceae bacterium]|nr:family 43 glycosylhydrolase [Clostridiaceae bacterium]